TTNTRESPAVAKPVLNVGLVCPARDVSPIQKRMPTLPAAFCAIGLGGVLMPEMSGWTIVSVLPGRPSNAPYMRLVRICERICHALVVICPVGLGQSPQSRLKWVQVWLMKPNCERLARTVFTRDGLVGPPAPLKAYSTLNP